MLLLANSGDTDPTLEFTDSSAQVSKQVAARPSVQPVLAAASKAVSVIAPKPKPAVVTLALAEFAGFGHDVDADERRFEEEELAREEFVSRCMKDMGFTYLPAPSVALDDIESLDREAFDAAMAAAATDPNDAYISVAVTGDARNVLRGARRRA